MKDFMLGCNFWDSKSGTDMWKNWDAESVAKDLDAMQEIGVEYMRVFPNWRDFQPVKMLYGGGATKKELAFAETEEWLLDNRDGIDYTMIQHFRDFANMAKERGIKLCVGVVTGWMSGRMFFPEHLNNLNLISDPEALMLQGKFIHGFVSAVQDLDNIVMWDLGNECNNLSWAASRAHAYTWSCFVRNAIQAADPKRRPIASGMHGLDCKWNTTWHIEDQGELCDMMTTHPYPSPSVKGDYEPYTRLRTTMVPTAQSEYYSGVSGKPCMIQEQGTFAISMGNRQMTANFIRCQILSAIANNLKGQMFWCGMEHTKLKNAPYRWVMMERELGLVDVDRKPKPVALEVKKMRELIDRLPDFGAKDTEAVCLLTEGQDKLVASTSCYMLAKEAGFNVQIRNTPVAKLPDAKFYIMPAVKGWDVMDVRVWDMLVEKIQNGAKLLFSYGDNPNMAEFEKWFGLRSNGVIVGKPHTAKFSFGEIKYTNPRDNLLESVGAEVLATNEEGNIVFSRNKVGKGEIYFLGFDVETLAANTTDGFSPDRSQEFYKIYKEFAKGVDENYIITNDNPYIGITQVKNDDGSYLVFAVNYDDRGYDFDYKIKDGWEITEVLYGDTKHIGMCDGVIVKVAKK